MEDSRVTERLVGWRDRGGPSERRLRVSDENKTEAEADVEGHKADLQKTDLLEPDVEGHKFDVSKADILEPDVEGKNDI
jgi:hypothetical protein